MKNVLGIVGFALLVQTDMSAQNWTGTVDSDWNNAANWSDWPLNNEDITIDTANYSGAASSPMIATNSVFTPDRMYVMNGASLMIAANLSVADRFIISDDAQARMTGGLLSADRLIMELGGGFTLDAGTINTGRLVLGDDGVFASSYTQHGGNVTVNTEFGFDCAVGPSTPVITLNAGTLLVNADAIWLGGSPSSGQGRFVVNGGSAQINGSLVNTLGSTIAMLVRVNEGTLTVNGPVIDLAHGTDSLWMTGGTCVLDGNLVFRNDGVMHAEGGSVNVMGQTELRGVGTYRFHDVSIASGASLRHTDPAQIAVAGNWSNGGSFDGDVNTVAFVGEAIQSVGTTTFFGLRVDNSSGITLIGTSSVGGTLSLVNGVVQTTTSDLLIVLNNGTVTGGSDLGYVDGPLRKVGNNDFLFPVGKNGMWRRMGIADITDQTTEYTAEFVDQSYANTTSLAPGLSAVSNTEYWTLARAATTDDARVQLFWEDAAASGITDCDVVVLAQWNGSTWEGLPSTTSGSCTANDAGSVMLDEPAASYIAFTFGTYDGTIGIKERDRTIDLRSYPQPSDTWTMIPWNTPTVSVRLIDGSGRIVKVRSDHTSEGVRIGTAQLPSGTYTALLTDAAGNVRRSLLVVAH